MRLLDGSARQGHVRERADVGLDADLVLGPEALDDLQALLEPPQALALRHLERIELDLAIAQPHAEDEVAAPDDVERGDALGHLDRVVKIDEQHAGDAGHLSRLGRQAREEGNELELAHAFAQVVLAGADRVPAAIPRQARHRELLVERGHHVGTERVLVGDEDADLHRPLPGTRLRPAGPRQPAAAWRRAMDR